jgi:hypothetical protein
MGPGTDPDREPDREPGMEPSMDQGRDPGRDPGMGPGMDPGREPGMEPGMTEEELKKKLFEAKAKYGRPFAHERPVKRFQKVHRVLPKSIFQFQKRKCCEEEEN